MADTKKYNRNRQKKPLQEVTSTGPQRGFFKFLGSSGYVDGTDLYVRWENINTALNRDAIEYVLLENPNAHDENKKYEAKITRVLERYKIHFVGEVIHKEDNKCYVLLDNEKIKKVATTPITHHQIGEKVKIKMTDFNLDDLKGEIVKSLGHKKDPGVQILSVLEEYDVGYEFPEDVMEEMKRNELNIEEHAKNPHRRDFTLLPLVTIDPPDSKDFDDAIAVVKTEDGYILYVAIADVWSYLKGNPATYREAQNRSVSIYFLNSVIPMLPEKLSNNFCSLVPDEKRCAMVFRVEVNKEGKILWEGMDVIPGIIRSHRRFNYGEVNDFLRGKNPFTNELPEVKENLLNSLELYRLLEERRKKKGYIFIQAPEVKIKEDKDGELKFSHTPRDESHALIENFMVVANEGIARLLERETIPGIYRIHERPDTNKTIEFINEIKRLKFDVEGEQYGILTQSLICKWFTANSNNPNLEIASLLLLRTMQKARYSVGNLGHFGLNLNHYLHFTSPIRRFPDLIVHKMLWEYYIRRRNVPKNIENPLYRDLQRICEHSNSREIVTSEIGREIEDIKIIQFFESHLDTVFKGRIVNNAKSGGTYVRLENLLIEGFAKYKTNLPLGKYVLVRPLHGVKEFKILKVL